MGTVTLIFDVRRHADSIDGMRDFLRSITKSVAPSDFHEGRAVLVDRHGKSHTGDNALQSIIDMAIVVAMSDITERSLA